VFFVSLCQSLVAIAPRAVSAAGACAAAAA
jgi:hypothetical protein